jgi:hypothetical protein
MKFKSTRVSGILLRRRALQDKDSFDIKINPHPNMIFINKEGFLKIGDINYLFRFPICREYFIIPRFLQLIYLLPHRNL